MNDRKKGLRFNIQGIVFRFNLLKKYVFFLSTINELLEERKKLVQIINEDYSLHVVVNAEHTTGRINDEIIWSHTFYESNQSLRNFRSNIIYEKHDMKYWGFENYLEYKIFKAQ